jgi:excisionase family DNA binding protein
MGDRARTGRQDSAEASEEVPLRERYLLGEAEVAALCGVSQQTVRRWKAAGFLRTVELPFGMRRNLYRRSEVEAFLEERIG